MDVTIVTSAQTLSNSVSIRLSTSVNRAHVALTVCEFTSDHRVPRALKRSCDELIRLIEQIAVDAKKSTNLSEALQSVRESCSRAWHRDEALVLIPTILYLHERDRFAESIDLCKASACLHSRLWGGRAHCTLLQLGTLAQALKAVDSREEALAIEYYIARRFSVRGRSRELACANLESGLTLSDLGHKLEARHFLDQAAESLPTDGSADDLRDTIDFNRAGISEALYDERTAYALYTSVLNSRQIVRPLQIVRTLRAATGAARAAVRLDTVTQERRTELLTLLQTLVDAGGSKLDPGSELFRDAMWSQYVLMRSLKRAQDATNLLIASATILEGTDFACDWRHRIAHDRLKNADFVGAAQLLQETSTWSAESGLSVECKQCMLPLFLDVAGAKWSEAIARSRLHLEESRDELLHSIGALAIRELDAVTHSAKQRLGFHLSLVLREASEAPFVVDSLWANLLLWTRSLPVALGEQRRQLGNVEAVSATSTKPSHLTRLLNDALESDRNQRARAMFSDWHARATASLHQCSLEQVATTLRDDGVLLMLDTVVISHLDPDERLGTYEAEHLIALVIRSDSAPRLYDLGNFERVEVAVHHLLTVIEGKDVPPEMAAMAVDDLDLIRLATRNVGQYVVDPVMDALKGRKQLFVLAAESLAMIPYDILTSEAGFLADEFRVSIVNSVLPMSSEAQHGVSRYLLVGGLDYSRIICAHCEIRRSGAGTGRSSRRTNHDALPGSLQEIQQVREWVAALDPSCHIRVLTECSACRHSLPIAMAKADIVHISTHGDCDSTHADSLPAKPIDRFNLVTHHAVVAPLASVRLILSGANQTVDSDSDGGVLTAAALVDTADLTHTRLVVLSVCDQGVGVRTGASGVASMQAAFTIAGCRDVIGAAYEVYDDQSATFMSSLYQNLLTQDWDPASALWSTKQEFAARDPVHTSLAAWAGWFVLSRGIA